VGSNLRLDLQRDLKELKLDSRLACKDLRLDNGDISGNCDVMVDVILNFPHFHRTDAQSIKPR